MTPSATFMIVLHKILSHLTIQANCRDTVTSAVMVKHFKRKLSEPLVKDVPGFMIFCYKASINYSNF